MSRAESKRRWREANPEKIKAHRRNHYRRKKGIPLDAPVQVKRHLTDEERRKEKRERNRKWALANPEKVRMMREKQKAKRLLDCLPKPPKEILSPEEKAARAKEKQREYNRRYRATHREKIREQSRRYLDFRKKDPEFRARLTEKKRQEYRRKHGLPLDAPVSPRGRKYATEEERIAANRESKRRAAAKKRAARKVQNAAKAATKPRVAEDTARAAQRAAEKRAAAAKAAKRAAPAVRKAPAPPPAVSPDPPELVALFAKAAKGQPPMPYNPRVRKLSVFHLRGAR